jgi:soluble lytic murein transglycosylase-like protein
MSLGPRLVIPGAIFASFLLTVLLLSLTARVTYPLVALAAAEATDQPQESAQTASSAQGQEPAVETLPPADAFSGQCDVSPSFPQNVLQWCDYITYYANERGLLPDLVAALILQESGGDPLAFSKSGAVGLMQVMPNDGLAATFMCQSGPCFSNRPSTNELQDPEFNIAYGTKYLASLLAKYGNLRDALKSYGPMNVGYYYADIVLAIFQNYGQ